MGRTYRIVSLLPCSSSVEPFSVWSTLLLLPLCSSSSASAVSFSSSSSPHHRYCNQYARLHVIMGVIIHRLTIIIYTCSIFEFFCFMKLCLVRSILIIIVTIVYVCQCPFHQHHLAHQYHHQHNHARCDIHPPRHRSWSYHHYRHPYRHRLFCWSMLRPSYTIGISHVRRHRHHYSRTFPISICIVVFITIIVVITVTTLVIVVLVYTVCIIGTIIANIIIVDLIACHFVFSLVVITSTTFIIPSSSSLQSSHPAISHCLHCRHTSPPS